MKLFALFVFLFPVVSSSEKKNENSDFCRLSPELLDEINSHQEFVDEIINAVTNGNYSGRVYEDLESFIDMFGNRMTGSQSLEEAIEYIGTRIEDELEESGEVNYDPVEVPLWKRGTEEAEVVTPSRTRKLTIKGLGFSPPANLIATLTVVRDFEELGNQSEEVKGKIVLFNPEFTKYQDVVQYITEGPAYASRCGAVAALVRSATPFSIGTLHTGATNFKEDDKPIPAAMVTLEDADYLDRIYRQKTDFIIKLTMTSKLEGTGNSSNLIIDIPGSLEPQNYAVISGHIDSWDVGQGVLDDGSGAFIALHSLLLLKYLNVSPPRRTMRSILWTAEEMGYIGAKSHLKTHEDEIKNWTSAYEIDKGVYPILGLSSSGNPNVSCVLEAVLSLFGTLNATSVQEVDTAGSDITTFQHLGVPLLEPYMADNDYFWFHHSEGDSMRVLNSTYLDQHLAFATATTYILANLSVPLKDFQNW